MTQNVEKVDRHAPALIDGVSYDTNCRESRATRSRTNGWCFL